MLFSASYAQESTSDFPAESMIRLRGILNLNKQPQTSAYPLLTVWVGEQTGQFQVTQVEPVVPEYPAEQELRRVSALGLRLLADKKALAALLDLQMQGRPIVIEGQLQVQRGNLKVRSVRAAAASQPTSPAKGQSQP
jgi:hypothetical protein